MLQNASLFGVEGRSVYRKGRLITMQDDIWSYAFKLVTLAPHPAPVPQIRFSKTPPLYDHALNGVVIRAFNFFLIYIFVITNF
jgi:hypothetical protein